MTAIKFKFISKKEKNQINNNKGIKAKGTCYFIINNKGIIISERITLSESRIEKINKEFLKINQTALTALSFLSGSNITGSETDRAKTPFYYDGLPNDKYNNYNFFNFSKKIRIRDKKFSLNSIDNIDDLIEIDTYFSRFPNITFRNKEINTKKIFEESKII